MREAELLHGSQQELTPRLTQREGVRKETIKRHQVFTCCRNLHFLNHSRKLSRKFANS